MSVKRVKNTQICGYGLWPNQVNFEELSALDMGVFPNLISSIKKQC